MKPRTFATFLALAALIGACSSDDGADGSAGPDSVASNVETTATPPPTNGPEATATVAETESSSETVDPTSTESTTPTAEISVEPSPYIDLAAMVTVDASTPVQVELTATSGDHVVEVPRTAALSDRHEIPLVGMRAERSYEITATLVDGDATTFDEVTEGEFTTGALPPWFDEHELTIDAERAAPGYTIVEFDTLQQPEGAPSSQHLIAYDNDGEVVWYYTNTGALAGVEPTPAGTFNMFYWPFGIREVDILGNVVGNWRPQRVVEADERAAGDAAATNDTEPDQDSDAGGDLVVENLDPDQVEFQGGIGALAGSPGDAEPVGVAADWIELGGFHHESWPMPNGNILSLSTTVHDLTPEQRATFCPDDDAPFNAISDVAVEFEPSGRVVRTWDLWDVLDIDEFPGEELCVEAGIFAEENTRDWNHANSVIYDPQRDAIIVSSRHTNQIVAFDYLDDEGPQTQLRWILGDGATMPLDGDPTFYQHAVEVNGDGSLVVYDNGNRRPGTAGENPENPPFSRAVIYEVDDASDDPDEWSARQRWEHVDLDDAGMPVYTSFIGDADVLENGNVLITHGGIGTFPPDPADPLNVLIREVVPEGDSGGDVVWELKSTDAVPYVAYRSERIPSFYFGPDWET